MRFCSAATDRAGFHSLQPTALTHDEREYDLPPLSTITLQQPRTLTPTPQPQPQPQPTPTRALTPTNPNPSPNRNQAPLLLGTLLGAQQRSLQQALCKMGDLEAGAAVSKGEMQISKGEMQISKGEMHAERSAEQTPASEWPAPAAAAAARGPHRAAREHPLPAAPPLLAPARPRPCKLSWGARECF